jgi:hypothetical protein
LINAQLTGGERVKLKKITRLQIMAKLTLAVAQVSFLVVTSDTVSAFIADVFIVSCLSTAGFPLAVLVVTGLTLAGLTVTGLSACTLTACTATGSTFSASIFISSDFVAFTTLDVTGNAVFD